MGPLDETTSLPTSPIRLLVVEDGPEDVASYREMQASAEALWVTCAELVGEA